MQFFYFSLCHACKRPSDDLKKCSNCKYVYYCCRTHQLLDWSQHKDICKAISKTSKFRVIPPDCTPTDFNHFKYTTSLLWRYELGRELQFVEQQMWMYPKVCSVCYSTESEIVCQTCLSVAYCSEEHQNSHKETHEKSCAALRLCMVTYRTLCSEELSTDWIYFKINPEVLTLPDTLQGVIKLLGSENPADFSKSHVDYIIMSEYFCVAINLLYGLEKCGFVENRQGKRPKINIHVVGPDETETRMSWVLIVEFLSHWITNLRLVKIFMIGPDLSSEEAVTITLKNCEECKAKSFTGMIVKVKGLYHDHVNLVPRPDLVVAFNSGLHEFTDSKQDTWKKSIPKLIQFRGVPTMLTAYTENELTKDLARFKESRVTYLVKPQRSPYSSLRPNRNWEEGSEPVFYQNGYMAMITKK